MIDHVINLIRKNDLKKAFSSLDDLLSKIEDTELHMKRDLLQSRFSRLREAEYQGLEKRYEEENAVTHSLIKLCYEIKDITTEKSRGVSKAHSIEVESEEGVIHDAISIFNAKISSLSYKSTQKDIEELLVLKDQLSSEIFEGLSQTIINTPVLRNYKPIVLFESIYGRDKFSDNLISEINEIRNDKDNYSASDRIIVVSGIVCSLLNFKRLDQFKVVLLFDFLSDNEEQVRDHALVGLIITLIFHNSRWQRFPVIRKKIEFLKQNVKIQDDLQMIESIFQTKIYEVNVIGEDHLMSTIEEISVVKYFLPYNFESEHVKNLVSTASDFERANELAESLVEAPIIDYAKYSILHSFSQKSSDEIDSRLQEDVFESEGFKQLVKTMMYLSRFQPFISIISNYYSYYNLFPTKAKIELFEKKLTIGRSKLRDYVLSEKKKYLIQANEYMTQEKYSQAISTWKDLLIVDPANKEALWKITECFNRKEDFANSIKYGYMYLDYEKDDVDMLRNISLFYMYNDDTAKSTKTIKKVLKLIKKDDQRTFFVAGKCFLSDNNINEALKHFEKAKKLKGNVDEYKILEAIGDCYSKKEKYNDALDNHLMALNFEPDNVSLIVDVANDYSNLHNYEKAYLYSKKAYKLAKNKVDVKFLFARHLFSYGTDPQKARRLLLEVNSKNPMNVIYGNLGHWELIYGDYENALKYYRKCVLMFEDIEEFVSKYDYDIPIVVKLGADKSTYLEIKDKMIEYYKNNNDQ